MTDALLIGLSVFGMVMVLGFVSYFIYVMKVKLQWNYIAREIALASVNALRAFAERQSDSINRPAGFSGPIEDEFAKLLRK